MGYYGFIEKNASLEVEKVYKFLQSCLSKAPKGFPLRGPKKYLDLDFSYQNAWEGEIDQYFGKEKILYKDRQIYRAFYLGGLVNLRSG
jgi:hypothetical protein